MNNVISTGRIPVKSWCSDLEDGALKQIENLSNLPFAFKWIAVMPDCHQGYGMPIGGVMATKGVVIPNAVGVDIGCGMCAVKTDIESTDMETLKKFMGKIREVIPLGFIHHKEKQNESLMPIERNNQIIVSRQYKSALCQLGTLGGGNHFIEIQKGSDGFIWVMIHSGSRNLGKRVADYYNKIAVEINKKYYSSVPIEWELSFLPIDSAEGQMYISEMQYCVDFALANRKLMIERVLDVMGTTGNMINIAHNYAKMEHHFGENVMVHRKGATLARVGVIGIIPGSQGTSSYIVDGLGNKDSFDSCSHGAGRKMGRKEACRKLNLDEEVKKMDELGIVHGMRRQDDLDESSSAYKDIDKVMESQKDLVSIAVKLNPLAVIKG